MAVPLHGPVFSGSSSWHGSSLSGGTEKEKVFAYECVRKPNVACPSWAWDGWAGCGWGGLGEEALLSLLEFHWGQEAGARLPLQRQQKTWGCQLWLGWLERTGCSLLGGGTADSEGTGLNVFFNKVSLCSYCHWFSLSFLSCCPSCTSPSTEITWLLLSWLASWGLMFFKISFMVSSSCMFGFQCLHDCTIGTCKQNPGCFLLLPGFYCSPFLPVHLRSPLTGKQHGIDRGIPSMYWLCGKLHPTSLMQFHVAHSIGWQWVPRLRADLAPGNTHISPGTEVGQEWHSLFWRSEIGVWLDSSPRICF